MAKHGHGTTISIAGNIIAGLKSIGGVELNVAMHDVTDHESANKFIRKLAGLISVGDIPISGNFDETDSDGQVGLVSLAKNQTAASAVVITLPPAFGASWELNALVSQVKVGDFPHDGEVPFSATLTVDGEPTLNITESAGLTTPWFAISDSAVITPAPANDNYSSVGGYVATVLNGVSSVTITPTAAAGDITVDGNAVASGVASSAIELTAGVPREVEVVVKETNKVPVTYKITIIRAAS